MKIKGYIASKLAHFRFFYGYLKHRVIISIMLNIVVGILDGFGLAMFLPLLQLVSEEPSVGGQELGMLQFIPDMLDQMGLPLTLLTILCTMCIFFFLKGLARMLSEGYRVHMIEYFMRNIRLDTVGGVNELSFKAFVQTDMGRIQNTLTGEVGRVVSACTAFFQATQQLAMVVVYIAFALLLDAQFAGLVVIGALLTNLLYRRIFTKTRGASIQVTRLSHKLEGFLIQLSNNFKYLKATGSLNSFGSKLRSVIVDVERQNRKIGMLNAILLSVKEPILVVVVSTVILLQHEGFGQPLKPILVSLLFFYRALTALIAIQNHWNKFIARIGSLENLVDFQHYLRQHKEQMGTKALGTFNNGLSISGMEFKYGDIQVLHDVNLDISKNETVAFVGESGSGKTTMVNIMAGLMPLDAGSFAIDGVDSRELDLVSFQSKIGYITQEPVIFNDTIFNNVTFWAEDTAANREKFERSIREAAIEDFIHELPEGESTVLGNNGINLSGGQKQRISIARELYKDIDILIMDEATSALDSETEREIQVNIEALKGNYTMLVVAHRLSTIKNADRVVLMDKGRISELGTFDSLREKSAKFRSMVEHQEF